MDGRGDLALTCHLDNALKLPTTEYVESVESEEDYRPKAYGKQESCPEWKRLESLGDCG